MEEFNHQTGLSANEFSKINGTRTLAFNILYKERIIGHPIRYKVL